MRQVVVGISDMATSRDANTCIVTYALGSCIAVVLWDPVLRAGGMLHYMLPLSNTCPRKAAANPCMFADTGIPHLFAAMYALGSKKKNLVVKVAGGGSLYDSRGTFEIGRRNYVVLRKLFWKNGIGIKAEDVGGSKSRTVRLSVADGQVTISSHGAEELL